MRKAVLLLAVLATIALAGCATGGNPAAEKPQLSPACGASVMLELGGQGPATRREAIEGMIGVYAQELKTAAPLAESSPTDDDSPVRLTIIVRGLTASLDQLAEAERASTFDGIIVVPGVVDGVKISEVYVEQLPGGGYAVTQFSASALTTDDPGCAQAPAAQG